MSQHKDIAQQIVELSQAFQRIIDDLEQQKRALEIELERVRVKLDSFRFALEESNKEIVELRHWPQGIDFEAVRVDLARTYNRAVSNANENELYGVKEALAEMRQSVGGVLCVVTPSGGIAEIERINAKVGDLLLVDGIEY